MKKLLLLLIVAVLLVFGGYYASGFVTEKSVHKLVHDIRETKNIDIKLVKYENGIFSSNALMNLAVKLPSDVILPNKNQNTVVSNKEYIIPIKLKIYHGPFVITKSGLHIGFGFAETELNFPSEYKDQLNKIFKNNTVYPMIKIGVLINFIGQAELKVKIPAFYIATQSNAAQLDFKGFKGSSMLALDLQKLKGSSRLSAVHFKQDDLQINVDKVDSEYKINRTKLGLYEGNAAFKMKSLLAKKRDKITLSLQEVYFKSTSKEQDDLFGVQINTGLEHFFIDDVSYGPAEVSVLLDKIDAKVLAKIRDQWQSAESGPASTRQHLFLTILPEVPALLAQGVTISVPKFSFTMPDGELKGDLSFSLPKNYVSNPFQILSHIDGSGHMIIPIKLMREFLENIVSKKLQKNPEALEINNSNHVVQQGDDLAAKIKALAEKKLSSLVESGALVQSDNDYTLDVKIEQGRINVNGKPFSPAMIDFM